MLASPVHFQCVISACGDWRCAGDGCVRIRRGRTDLRVTGAASCAAAATAAVVVRPRVTLGVAAPGAESHVPRLRLRAGWSTNHSSKQSDLPVFFLVDRFAHVNIFALAIFLPSL